MSKMKEKKVLLGTPFLTYSWNTGSFIFKALTELGHPCYAWDYRMTPRVPDVEYDLAIIHKGESLNPDDLKSPKINWFPDRLSRFPELHGNLKKYDKVLTWNKPEYEWAEWLPLGYDPSIHRDLGIERKLDCIYIGTANSKRKVEWLTAIKPQMIFGSNWQNYGINAYPPLHIPEFIRLMNMSKIVLNVHEESIGPNGKVYEIPPCGFMLVDRVEGIEDVFGKLTDRIAFSSPREARELITYYLENPKELETVWHQQRDKIKDVTCLNQVRKLIEAIE